MFRAQTLSLRLGEVFSIACTASRVSDFMIRMRGGAGSEGVELVVGFEVDVDVDVEAEGDWANACVMGEYRSNSVFLSPFRAKGCDFRRAGIVVLIVSFASLARAPLLSQGRMSDLEEEAMGCDLSSGEIVCLGCGLEGLERGGDLEMEGCRCLARI